MLTMILGSIFTGAGLSLLTNLVESLFGVVKDWQRRKLMVLEHTQALEIARVNAEITRAQAESARETTAMEMEGAAFTASYEHATAIQPGYRFISAILSLVRPVLTIGLIFIAYRLVQQSADEALAREATLAILALAATAVSWWFGDRTVKHSRSVR